jgi:hypothetical protein
MRMHFIVIYACPAPKYFFTLSRKHHHFRQILLNLKSVLWYKNVAWTIYHTKKNFARYDQKCILFLMQNILYFWQILTKLRFSRQMLKKFWNIKYHENASSGSRVSSRRRVDRQADMTKLIVDFRNLAKSNWKQINIHSCSPSKKIQSSFGSRGKIFFSEQQ